MTAKLVLHKSPMRPWGAPDLSPFCAKLECYLRMSETPHEVAAADFRRAPKGKVPYVAFGHELMGDSQLIIERLEKASPKPLDGWLNAEQKTTAHLVRRTLEEGTYFTGVYFRWIDDGGFAVLAPEFRKLVPSWPPFLPSLIRGNVRKANIAQGTGRHTPEQVAALGIADWSAVAQVLGSKPYLLGDQPCVADTTLFGFTESVLAFPYDAPIRRHVQGLANIVAFRARVRERWWKDLPQV